MTRLAHLLLVLTSVAPVLFVYGASLAIREPLFAACIMLGVASLALLFWAIMAQAGRVVEEERKELKDVSSMEKEPLAFLVAYALPVVTATAKPATGDAMAGAAALLAFVVVMAIVVWQQQLFYVNPLAAMMGCHFFSGTRESGEKVLVVSRRKVTSIKSMRVAVLSEYLWLEVDAEQ